MARQVTPNVQSVTHGSVTLKIYEIHRDGRIVFSISYKESGHRKLKQFGDMPGALKWAGERAKEIDKGKAPSLMLRC